MTYKSMLIILFVLLKVALSDYINSITFSVVLFTQPSNTDSPFTLQLQLYYSNNTKAQIPQISVTISLIPYSPLKGVLTVYTDIQGLAAFSSVYSKYKGTFTLVAIANNYSPYSSGIFTIPSGNTPFYAMDIGITSPAILSSFFLNQFEISVYDSDLSLMEIPCTFTFYVYEYKIEWGVSAGTFKTSYYWYPFNDGNQVPITVTCDIYVTSIYLSYRPVTFKLEKVFLVSDI